MSVVVKVARQWHAPEITHEVTDAAISISLPLDDFLRAVLVEIQNPAILVPTTQRGVRRLLWALMSRVLAFTPLDAMLEQRLAGAAQRVVQGMKDETARVM